MNRFEDYLRNRDPILYEEISDEQKEAETRMSRRGLATLKQRLKSQQQSEY